MAAQQYIKGDYSIDIGAFASLLCFLMLLRWHKLLHIGLILAGILPAIFHSAGAKRSVSSIGTAINITASKENPQMLKQASVLATAVALASQAMASGYKINEQSASGVGNAYAGRAAVAEDASVVFYNPAGMTRLKRPELSVGVTYIDVNGSFEGERLNSAGVPSDFEQGAYGDGGDFVPNPTIPFMYYVRPLDDKAAIGLGIFAPFGTHTDYDSNALVGGFADETKLTTIDIQPTFAYQLTDTLSIGVGIDIVFASGLLSKQLDTVPFVPEAYVQGAQMQLDGSGLDPNSAAYLQQQAKIDAISGLNDPSYLGYDNKFEVEGDDRGYGWNFGVMWDITPVTTFGFAYRSEIDLDLEGTAEFKQNQGVEIFAAELKGHPLLDADNNGIVLADAAIAAKNGELFGLSEAQLLEAVQGFSGEVKDQDARVPLTTPRSATFSLAHSVNDRLQLQGGATWTDWSVFKYFDVIATRSGIIDDISGLGENYIGHIVEKWHDTWSYALGASYRVNHDWLLRAGYAFDESPVAEKHRTARVPDNDRQWLTAGAKYHLNDDISFDMGIAYLLIDESDLNEYDYDLDDEVKGLQNATGTYDMDALGVSLQMNYRM
ncbi:hypothetical protein CHH28_10910 [Bacterioplanes sanyensis]|uniref:Long-chain fatty acid transporter n=2 Tax=Bacterioplanes sanyensis TaxID=1249553 RepID=A0A222FKP1_9GAMM|nr:hypothetical protein CHH28_10910 [Bacterioplanes sanyensis]